MGNKISVDALKGEYKDLKLGTDYTVKVFFVDGGSAKGVNKLYASEDGTKVYADAAKTILLATIDPVTGIVKFGETGINTGASDKAKELLNAAAHTDLANSVTARVAVKAILCEGKDNETVISVDNNEFNVKFLRPITITEATATFEDAETKGSDAPVVMTFVDWRDHNFGDKTKTKGMDYFVYYGVEKIELDTENATTDLNGGNHKLSDVTTQLKFTYTPASPVSLNNYGTLHYENNGMTVGHFTVTFPAVVTYHWGKVNTTVKCTVGKTQANAKRR